MCTLNNNNSRRGVTLLVVLALMVMFAMLVTTFMIIVTQMRRNTESIAKARIDPPRPQTSVVEAAFQKLLTGGLDNVIGPHSILENLYGHPREPISIPSGEFTSPDTQDGLLTVRLASAGFVALQRENLIGQVVTLQFTDTKVSLHNKSTTIFDVQINGDVVLVQLVPFNVPNALLGNQKDLLNRPDCTLFFNPPAHSGTGAGYIGSIGYTDIPNSGSARLSLSDDGTPDGKPFALRPNALAPNVNGVQYYKTYLEGNYVRMNPDYTAPDFMTMFLAWNDVKNNNLDKIIPSFHRPQLIRYWQKMRTASPLSETLTELRKYVLRPLPTDHPDFTGGNPAAIWNVQLPTENEKLATLENFLTKGPWDVDNDGDSIADGIWLDAGLPVQYDEKTKSHYKPLVSYYVLDMDGRISVNTIGNTLGETAPILTDQESNSGSIDVKGTGLGPAELSSDLISSPVLNARYGNNEPNNIGVPNFNTSLSDGLQPDWFGYSQILFDPLGNRVVKKPTTTPTTSNPYNFNPYSESGDDKPFSPDELESLLHSVLDINFSSLPQRLRTSLGDLFDPAKPAIAPPNLRYNLTTRSSDIPASARYLHNLDDVTSFQSLYSHIMTLCSYGASDELEIQKRANAVWMMLPEEIRRGGKVNLNRLTSYQGDQAALSKAKAKFAQEIFYLLRILVPMQVTFSDGVTEAEKEAMLQYRLERLAQWSVNLVDFIDPDDVLTPLIYNKTVNTDSIQEDQIVWQDADSTTPDCSALIDKLIAGQLSATDLTNRNLVWGFEKPEVVITETLAIHDRNVVHHPDTENGTTGKLVQAEPPQGSLFVELYRQGNPQRSYLASSTVDSSGVLPLDKKTPNNDYVWRLAIGEPAKMIPGNFQWNQDTHPDRNAFRQLLTPENGEVNYPQFYQWNYTDPTATEAAMQYHPDLGMPERFVWFGENTTPTVSVFTPEFLREIQRRSYYHTGTASLDIDETAVIASRQRTDLAEPQNDSMAIAFAAGIYPTQAVTEITDPDATFPVGMNISEPLPTWTTDGNHLLSGYTGKGIPNHLVTGPPPFDDDILLQRGTIPCYKTICLQRLADPNRAYHPIGNPYLTVDWSMIDLQVINSIDQPEDGSSEGLLPNNPIDGDMRFSSRQWLQKTSSFYNPWDRTLTETELADAKAGLKPHAYTNPDGWLTSLPLNTLGKHNYDTSEVVAFEPPPLLHFPWHDAPLMNSAELMLVPMTAPGRLGIEYHDNGNDISTFFGLHEVLFNKGSANKTENPRFGYHYQDGDRNFAYSPYWNWGNYPEIAFDEPHMQRLFDFVYVPSKFAGTIQGKTTDTNRPIYSMREPGKLNLNTLTEAGWNTLAEGHLDFPSYEVFRSMRQWSQITEETNDYPSEFKPFRTPSARFFIPPLDASGGNSDRLYDTTTSTTLMGLEDNTDKPVLIVADAVNPYTALEKVMRLSDVTTTRSNVFAVWVTVGYFNVKKFENLTELKSKYGTQVDHIVSEQQFNAIYPDKYVLGTEKGVHDGTVKRHRAFYLIDRSIPVGFRRGEELNSQEVILKRTILD